MKKNILIAITCLAFGFILATIFIAKEQPANKKQTSGENLLNPFSFSTQSAETTSENSSETRLNNLEVAIEQLKQELQKVELIVNEINATTETNILTSRPAVSPLNRYTSAYNQRLYNVENLIKGGIDPGLAEDIVRRKNSIELKRLELQDYASRNDYLNTQRYLDELDQINSMDINLRKELGDQRYDEYLYNSKQNNRVRISSIMFDSPAEQAGIEKDDIVLSYDNKRIFTWQELKDATAEGELGEYVSLGIYRNSTIYSFSVPRGTLGMELGATRLAP